jgi:hypothetical protein
MILSPGDKLELHDAVGSASAASSSGSNNGASGSQAAAGGQSNLFGAPAAHPTYSDLNTSPNLPPQIAAPAGNNLKAGDQLLSAAGANGNLRPNFDDGTATSNGSLVFPNASAQTPATVELKSHIPNSAWNDSKVNSALTNEVAYYRNLELKRIQDSNNLDAATRNGSGTLQIQTYRNQVINDTAAMNDAQNTVKKIIENDGLQWSESTPTSPSGVAGAASAPVVPGAPK